MTATPSPLHRQRCFHHAEREAVAQCPSCQRFHCRECITEHDHRVICTTCLNRLLQPPSRPPAMGRALLGLAQLALGFVLLWLLFATLGQVLIALPSSFHEGTVWKPDSPTP